MFHYTDRLSLKLTSGSGGDGCLSFFRTRKNPRGGPDGGDGGDGGSLIFASSSKVNGFEHLKKIKQYKASPGESGGKQLKKGKKGKDITVLLPIGTLVRNDKGQILKDFTRAKKEIFLEGGRGGRGNFFFKSSANQAPRRAQKGRKGQTQSIILEYKPLVDVALIGKVNTGKSSFFNLVTKAQSKVASYPYTTLTPALGKLKSWPEPRFIMDIPGLEKGASQNSAKGLAFLRSIQRASLLLHFIDGLSEEPLRDKIELESELRLFDKKYNENYFKALSRKKSLFILSKIDQLSHKRLNQIIKQFKLKKNQQIFPLSNKTKKGLKKILSAF